MQLPLQRQSQRKRTSNVQMRSIGFLSTTISTVFEPLLVGFMDENHCLEKGFAFLITGAFSGMPYERMIGS